MDAAIEVVEDCLVVCVKGRIEARHVNEDDRLNLFEKWTVDVTLHADIFACSVRKVG